MNGNKKSPHEMYRDMANDAVSLKILDIIEQDQKVSQNKITLQTGLAAGLVHSYMRKIIGKGWVKANQVSAKRWLYYLTPEGFLEKSRLTIKYLSITLDSYRLAQDIIADTLADCEQNGWRRLVVVGVDHLAEILILNIKASSQLKLAGVVANEPQSANHLNVDPISFDQIHHLHYDRILVSDVTFIEYCKASDDAEALTAQLIHLGAEGVMNGKKQ